MDANKKWIIATVIVAAIGFGILGYAHRSRGPAKPKIVQVTASFYPMAEFTRQVGGNLVHVTTITKPGADPRTYKPTPKDIATVYSSKMFVYNGAGLERWADNIQSGLTRNDVMSIEASYGITLQSGGDAPGGHDPHVWLDPQLAIKEVNTIRIGLSAVDPTHISTYRANAQNYIARLQALNEAFSKGLTNCPSSTVTTRHQQFSYLAKHYNLIVVNDADTDAAPALNSIENITDGQQRAHQDYISLQLDNLHHLQAALQCTE